jgi:4-carboxymuconolactone decarboxylase
MNMTEKSRRAVGEEFFRKVIGSEPPKEPMSKYSASAVDFCFGEVWSDPTLSIKQRRLISLTAAAFVGDPGLRAHISGALGQGEYSVTELEAWVMHLSVYAGNPIASRAMFVLREEAAKLKK